MPRPTVDRALLDMQVQRRTVGATISVGDDVLGEQVDKRIHVTLLDGGEESVGQLLAFSRGRLEPGPGRKAIAYKNATLNGVTVLFRWPGPSLAHRYHVDDSGVVADQGSVR